jgi:tRNA-Thr(GGU) m(6)t(6)A37 methyltransferase TsaA
LEKMPIQPSGALGIPGQVEILEPYIPALKDLEGFSHLYLLYHFHKVNDWTPHVIPFLADTPHGLFSTRAPKRPNPLGLSIVKLNHIQAGILFIENVDILDGTPLLDIKPYVPVFDHFEVDRIGWLEGLDSGVTTQRSDQRFKE